MASESRLTIVELVKSLNTLHTETILQLVREVVKKPHQIKGEQVLKNMHTETQDLYTEFLFFFNVFFYFSLARSRRWSIYPCYSSAMPISKGKSEYLTKVC